MEELSLVIEKPLTVSESVYEKLHDHVVYGHLKPGQRLTEEQLAKQMNVSRTPVREALRRLAQEGLVELLPHQGAVVRQLTLEEAHHVYEIRAILEGLAAGLATQRMSAQALADIEATLTVSRQVIAQHDVHSLIVQNNQFHDLIMAAANNPLLKKILGSLRSQINLLRITIWATAPERLKRTLEEHEQIYEALAAGDEKKAERAAKTHIEHSWDMLREVLLQQRQVAAESVKEGDPFV